MSYKLKLNGDKIIVKPTKEAETTAAGVYVPQQTSKQLTGVIIEAGDRADIDYKKGVEVMYLQGGIEINYDGEECILLTSGLIVGTIERTDKQEPLG